MPVVLRDYQTLILDDIHRQARERPLVIMPTGAGKTVVGAEIGWRTVHNSCGVLWLVHRRELVAQGVKHLEGRGLEVGVIMGGEATRPHAPVHVASIQTLKNRPTPTGKRVMMYDEAHHSAAKGNTSVLSRPEIQDMLWVGLTATGARLDGKPLKDAGWGCIVEGPSTGELISREFLVPFKYFAPTTPNMTGVKKIAGDFHKGQAAERMLIVGDPVDHYRQYLTGGKAIVFGVTVEHSQWMAGLFEGAGIPCAHIDGKTPQEERDAVTERLQSGDLKVVCNVGIYDEGFDCPAIDGVIMARPSHSLVWARQAAGRCLRTSPGKRVAIIIDMAGNWERVGLPDDKVVWSLEGKAKRQGEGNPWRQCTQCWAIVPIGTARCPECGAVHVPEHRRPVKHVAGDLRQVRDVREEDFSQDELEAYWRILIDARGKGWKLKRAQLDFKRRTGAYPVGKATRELERLAQQGCQHSSVADGVCRFCSSRIGWF